MIGTRPRCAFSLVLAVLATACSNVDTAVEKAADRSSPPAEASVRPGINDRFLSEDLDPAWARETFESESREIYACRQKILELLELTEGMDVADIGAGTGFFASLFASKVGPSGTVYAVEISPVLLDYLREKKSSEDLENVEVVESKATTANLEDGSVDLVFTSDTYHHFEFPDRMLESIHQALRPGGQLVVVDFERIEGVSGDWTLEHVRAGKAEVQREIEAAGFELTGEAKPDCLKENYVLRFRKR